jgi:tetratricopeptide (TPR) repeat protein
MRLPILLLVFTLAAPAIARADDVVVDEAAEEAFFRGVALLQAEAYAEALVEFEEALQLQPDLRRVHYYRAMAHLRVGDYALAREAADRYGRFDLDEGEARQLQALHDEFDALDPEGHEAHVEAEHRRAERESAEHDDEEEPPQTAPRMDADQAMTRAERALTRGNCVDAVNLSDQALRLDPRAWRAFVLKGRGLLCTGEAARARSILLAFQELHSGRDSDTDAEVAALLHTVEAAIIASAGPVEPPAGGNDPAVRIAFGSILAPHRSTLERRSKREMVPGVGLTRTRRARFDLAGSRAEARWSWVADHGRLRWVRVRVWGRRGADTARWFEDAFQETWAAIARDGGAPVRVEGIRRDGSGGRAASALAGFDSHLAEWRDEDGDRWALRLGRCTEPGKRGRSLVRNAPCMELLGHTGAWRARDGREDEVLAVIRSQAPGLRTPDFSVNIMGSLPTFSAWYERGETYGLGAGPPPGATVGGGILARFAFEGLAWGAAWEFSAAGTLVSTNTPVFFENRVMFYIGGRLGPRQPTHVDILFAGGFVPDAAGVYPSLGVRFVGSSRTTRFGRIVVSVEPHVIVSADYVTIVPFRFNIGGAIGTTPRPIRGG